MRAERRKKLQAKGWKVGDAGEFLGLSPVEEICVDLRLALADALKKTRTRKSMTQTRLAAGLGSSQSRIAKMEAGDEAVSLDLLIRSLLTLGVSRRDLGRIVSGGRSNSAA